jgi:hypothetical protein
MCNKIIVVSDHPTHYGVCAACPTMELTEAQKEKIERGFN